MNNPSTALDVRLSASVPPESEIEVFRKVKSPEDSLRMGEIPYVKFNADIVPPPNSNRSQSLYNADFRTDFQVNLVNLEYQNLLHSSRCDKGTNCISTKN